MFENNKENKSLFQLIIFIARPTPLIYFHHLRYDEFVNLKNLASFNVQGTCEGNEMSRVLIASGRAQSTHDARIFINLFIYGHMRKFLLTMINNFIKNIVKKED